MFAPLRPTLTKMRKDRTVAYVKHREKYIDGKKLCYRCDNYFDVSNYNKSSRNEDGLGNECKQCNLDRNKERYHAMKPDEKQRKAEAQSRYRDQNRKGFSIIHMMNGIKQRCKKSGKGYEIDRRYIEEKLEIGRCEATGIKFLYERNGRGGVTPFSPSVDCIDPEKGYTVENTQIVCSMYNIGKARHDETDFIAMCMAVAERNRGNTDAERRMTELLQ